jgi:hypothetical protein
MPNGEVPTRVTLDIDLPEGVTSDELRQTIRDAFGEFVSHRGPTPEEYVDRRYDLEVSPEVSPRMRRVKVAQVRRRVELARRLYRAEHRIEGT